MRRSHRSLFGFILFCCSWLLAQDTRPIVAVTGGRIQGRIEGSAALFEGIPFAQPPVGDLRWRDPLPVKPWDDVKPADRPGSPCAQSPAGWNDNFVAASSEDCLYLTVWTPSWPPTSGKPVMVWIHGGANTGGAGGFDPLYHGTALVSHDVVLVLLQYRLGIFGFFAHPELTRESPHHSSGNYAILDQIAALRWVHDNIAKFGGDPGNVTVFGQSAGSIDAMFLMTSPLSKGLFHRVIGESGGVLAGRGAPALASAEQRGAELATQLKATSLPALRSLSTAELLKSAHGPALINIDGWVFPEAPGSVFVQGKQRPVPLLLGSNAIEFPAAGSPEELRKRVEADYGSFAPKMLTLYGLQNSNDPAPPDPVFGTLNDQVGTDGFRCGVVLEGEYHSRAGNPTWEYQFDRAIPPHPQVTHSGELAYVFGNLYSHGSQAGEFQDADRKLSSLMQMYWTNFAKSGDPNGKGIPEWPRFNAKDRAYLNFGKDGSLVVRNNQRGPYCDVYREGFKNTSLR